MTIGSVADVTVTFRTVTTSVTVLRLVSHPCVPLVVYAPSGFALVRAICRSGFDSDLQEVAIIVLRVEQLCSLQNGDHVLTE